MNIVSKCIAVALQKHMLHVKFTFTTRKHSVKEISLLIFYLGMTHTDYLSITSTLDLRMCKNILQVTFIHKISHLVH